jgi:hypothetical protein
MLSWLLLALSNAQQLATLEQNDNKIYLGAWYDRLNGDTPSRINARVNHRPLSFFQSDMNITETLQSAAVDQFIQHIEETNTDAFIFLTIYPYEGFDRVSEAAIEDLIGKVKKMTDLGRKVMIRYASEMNGDWFAYGQKPTAFIRHWTMIVNRMRAAVGRDNVAFLWSPNSGNGYPYGQGPYAANINSTSFDRVLDTNGDGAFNVTDDPYTPYYPGDDLVDWVGFSIYHYGNIETWAEPNGWTTNDIPAPGKVEDIVYGRNGYGTYHFYEMFSGSGAGGNPRSRSRGGKPFFISESSATVFLAINNNMTGNWLRANNTSPEFRVRMKQNWWRQLLNATFLEKFPKIKGLSFFEFVKYEETSWRDFTILGKGTEINSIFGNDAGDLNGPVLEAFRNDIRGDIGNLIKWGSAKATTTTAAPAPTKSSDSIAVDVSKFALTVFGIVSVLVF